MHLRIQSPVRLHFGLIDLNGDLGRIDGGVGVSLQGELGWIIDAKAINAPHDQIETSITNPQFLLLVKELLHTFRKATNLSDQKVKLMIHQNIPAHVGLGSHTQLALALATLLAHVAQEEHKFNIRQLAQIMNRGGTSGIGVAAFEQGGFILDGGHKFGPDQEKTAFLPSSASKGINPAPVLFRSPLPNNWQFIIVLPAIKKGASGKEEINLFQSYCPIPANDVKEICRLILMKVLPAVVEKDLKMFGSGIYELQHQGFKKFEIEIQHPIISRLINLAVENGAAGAGMSSFGPATFAIAKSTHISEVDETWRKLLEKNQISYQIWTTSGNNHGAEVSTL
ncbi:MAG: beta-ribofuranosylaminobenzene 5'-phosphate synthase [Candidatus Hodarchaeota archaeon]